MVNNVDENDSEAVRQLLTYKLMNQHNLNIRSLYDPAYRDWSNYFERRSVFDPAYRDWANTFKREID
ncbi:unnamed protein product [Didymodactylos carnosus]|uniref:Uncharacterized protein n=1 Tax=Didymodactylos carnosus TaxID=1234261 RepID=A0A813QEE2_9BILA|nr:unnamed protein product [Didymodactylos carnosus]CAF1266540.1 unnamed protein product [Didymodactylos carnosus]CAF3547966.1 unnamed protein product [Didymodactylos carnosus]CAF4072572.1 unnamed protein product [Didymodactylos carnosus]